MAPTPIAARQMSRRVRSSPRCSTSVIVPVGLRLRLRLGMTATMVRGRCDPVSRSARRRPRLPAVASGAVPVSSGRRRGRCRWPTRSTACPWACRIVVVVDAERPVDLAQGPVDLAPHLVGDPAELANPLPELPADLGQLLRPDDQQRQDEDDHEFHRTDVEHATSVGGLVRRYLGILAPGSRPGIPSESLAARSEASFASRWMSSMIGCTASWNSVDRAGQDLRVPVHDQTEDDHADERQDHHGEGDGEADGHAGRITTLDAGGDAGNSGVSARGSVLRRTRRRGRPRGPGRPPA